MKGAQIVKMPLPCSIQDLGRALGQDWGVPLSGAMDQHSARRVNAILGNAQTDAVLECCILGPDIIFHQSTRIAISGATCQCLINGKTIEPNQALSIAPGDILKIGRCTSGRYVYLGIDGGILCNKVLESRSFTPALEMGAMCTDGFLPYGKPKNRKSKEDPSLGSIDEGVFIRVTRGPEFEKLPEHLQKQLFSRHFTLSEQCDRTGYRLSGMQIQMQIKEMLSSGVFPGVIQLPPSGYPIVLMRDAPPTGGYPRILVVKENDLSKLSQKSPGDIIKFTLSKVDER